MTPPQNKQRTEPAEACHPACAHYKFHPTITSTFQHFKADSKCPSYIIKVWQQILICM